MSVIASQLIGKVGLEGSDKTKADLTEIGKKTSETESSFKKLREQVARGFEFGTGMQLAQIPGSIFDAAKEQVVDIIKLAMDHQQIMSQTNQVLKSTHDVSKMTADALDELAQKFGKTTQFSADTVQQGENLLLTFTNIGHQVFPQATQAILDVSQAMGQDLKESAIQVGKALGDPLTGFANLQRIGVTFSESEKEQIKTMMAHNNIIGAQKVILKELATEFGGSAQAAGKTFAGALKIAQDRVEEIKIKIGTALMPILNEFLAYFEQHMLPRLDDFSTWFQTKGIPRIQDFGDWFQHTGIPALQDFGGKVGDVVGDLTSFVGWLQKGGPAADAVKVAITGIGIAIAGVKTAQFVNEMQKGLNDIIGNAGKMKDTFVDFLGWFKDTFVVGVKSGAGEAATATKGIGDSAGVAQTETAVASGEMDAEIAGVGATAKGTSLSIKGIGTSIGLIAGSLGILIAAEQGAQALGEWLHVHPGILNASQTGQNVNDTQNGPLGPIINNLNNSSFPTSSFHHGPRFASGTSFAPGGWSLVGEQGPEMMYVPRGASILPNGAIPSGGQGSAGQTIILTIDGVQFARVIAPYTTNHMRYSVGSIGW